jgi:hypothetical protein
VVYRFLTVVSSREDAGRIQTLLAELCPIRVRREVGVLEFGSRVGHAPWGVYVPETAIPAASEALVGFEGCAWPVLDGFLSALPRLEEQDLE